MYCKTSTAGSSHLVLGKKRLDRATPDEAHMLCPTAQALVHTQTIRAPTHPQAQEFLNSEYAAVLSTPHKPKLEQRRQICRHAQIDPPSSVGD